MNEEQNPVNRNRAPEEATAGIGAQGAAVPGSHEPGEADPTVRVSRPPDQSMAEDMAQDREQDLETEGLEPQGDLDAQKLVGTRLAGKYLITDVLGAGGMSVVYKAVQDSVDRVVAIKTLKLQVASDPVILQRFQREILSLSKLNHPNIITVYDCALGDNNQPFIVMDFVSGESLASLLESSGRLTPEQARRLFVQSCNALEHAHRHGVVHRDIKPGNIMLSARTDSIDYVKIVDFGLAKLTEDKQKLTQTGHLWGSAPYMSPEQCEASAENPIDWRTDIYSFGAVMYEVLTGADPFLGDTIVDTIWNHLHQDPPRFSKVDPTLKVSPIVETIVFKCLQKNKEDRFQSMLELKEAIEAAIPDTPAVSGSRAGATAVSSTAKTAKTRASTRQKAAPSPLAALRKKPKKSGGPTQVLYGFLSGAMLVCVVFMFNNLLGNHRAQVEQRRRAAEQANHPRQLERHENEAGQPLEGGNKGENENGKNESGKKESGKKESGKKETAATASASPHRGKEATTTASEQQSEERRRRHIHSPHAAASAGSDITASHKSHPARPAHAHPALSPAGQANRQGGSDRWTDLENLRSN